MRVLVGFRHGLGDAVQLTSVLRHLVKHRPTWDVEVASLVGKHSAFHGLCRQSHSFNGESDLKAFLALAAQKRTRETYDHVFDLDWHECATSYADSPSTKAERCLREVFDIQPDPALWGYQVNPALEDMEAARTYLDHVTTSRVGRSPVCLIHYQGNTSAAEKNMSHEDAKGICDRLPELGLIPVILDWDKRSKLPDGKTVFCPDADHPLWKGTGTGDAGRLAALIKLSALFIGCDSGPLHVAAATDTPTIAVWTGHHPLHYLPPAPHVRHLIPAGKADNVREPRAAGSAFFREHYSFSEYDRLAPCLLAEAAALRGVAAKVNPMSQAHLLKARNFHVEYYDQHKAAGLDYLGHGQWQEEYGRWLVESLDLRGKEVLDVGCAAGSIALGIKKAGANVHGIDLNNHTIALGREHFPTVPLYVCDAVNLHLFGDASFDLVHTNNVAEHWRPDLVPFILAELFRVLKPGGLLFMALDTVELFKRQERDPAAEDATNRCIQTWRWWDEGLKAVGFLRSNSDALRGHPLCFFKRYDWDWVLMRKP